MNYILLVICIQNISKTSKILQGKMEIKGLFECLENSTEKEGVVKKKKQRCLEVRER